MNNRFTVLVDIAMVAPAIAATVIAATITFNPEIEGNFNRRSTEQDYKTYIESMVSDLAKYRYEHDKIDSDIEKEAIKSLIRERYSNFDRSKIENEDLAEFLENCGL